MKERVHEDLSLSRGARFCYTVNFQRPGSSPFTLEYFEDSKFGEGRADQRCATLNALIPVEKSQTLLKRNNEFVRDEGGNFVFVEREDPVILGKFEVGHLESGQSHLKATLPRIYEDFDFRRLNSVIVEPQKHENHVIIDSNQGQTSPKN